MKYKGIVRQIAIKNRSNIDKYTFLNIEIENNESNEADMNYLNGLFLKEVELEINEAKA